MDLQPPSVLQGPAQCIQHFKSAFCAVSGTREFSSLNTKRIELKQHDTSTISPSTTATTSPTICGNDLTVNDPSLIMNLYDTTHQVTSCYSTKTLQHHVLTYTPKTFTPSTLRFQKRSFHLLPNLNKYYCSSMAFKPLSSLSNTNVIPMHQYNVNSYSLLKRHQMIGRSFWSKRKLQSLESQANDARFAVNAKKQTELYQVNIIIFLFFAFLFVF